MEEFKCNGCGHELPNDFCMRTKDYCYMCDPNITVDELLSDEPIEKSKLTKVSSDEIQKGRSEGYERLI